MTDPAAGHRPAVAVKVPDTRVEHPQVGINEADIVFVQADGYVDSSGRDSTRLMPVYHSSMAKGVGPVRSLRPVDVPLLAPMTAVVGSSGAAPWVEAYVASNSARITSDLVYLKMRGTGAYSVNQARVYKYNGKTEYDRALVCHPEVLGAKSGSFPNGPQSLYLPFATGDEKPSTEAGASAVSIGVPWKGDKYIMGYTWDPKTSRYLRSMPWGPHVLADGSRVTTENVLVIRAKVTRRKLIAGGGEPEPIHEIMNATGAFHYANGGKIVTGTWAKAGVADPFVLTLSSGAPLVMAPGRTFVELAPEKAVLTIS